jgi:monoamine oxidase
VHLAGDYTESDYPATLESAVRSGLAAAAQVIGQSRLARSAVRPVAMTPA